MPMESDRRVHLCDPWFSDWLEYHKHLHPNARWIDPEEDPQGFSDYFEGWKEAFDKWGLAIADAREISRELQSQGPVYPERTLARMEERHNLRQDRLKAKRATTPSSSREGEGDPEYADAARESRGCPECTDPSKDRPTGYAVRTATYKLRQLPPLPAACNVFCRCPLGKLKADRLLAENPGKPPPEIELQSRPDLWDPALDHASWSDQPSGTRFRPCTVSTFLPVSDPRSKPRDPRETLRRLARGVPAATSPAKPAPEPLAESPAPVPAPTPVAPAAAKLSPKPVEPDFAIAKQDVRMAIGEDLRRKLDVFTPAEQAEVWTGLPADPKDSDVAEVKRRIERIHGHRAAPMRPPRMPIPSVIR